MANDVKPCPCCGAEAEVNWAHHHVHDPNGDWLACVAYVRCQGCGLTTKPYTKDSDRKAAKLAVEAWNRRSPELPDGATLVDASGEVVG